jgi:hypothetical protein
MHSPETTCNDGFCDTCWIPVEWEVRRYHEDAFTRPQATFADYASALTFRDEADGRFVDVSRREPSEAMQRELAQQQSRNAARWDEPRWIATCPPHATDPEAEARLFGVSGELV